eukprot:CAMPEP_0179245296 /NCGR_PEP_ID=MMETSP0797-20121207/18500_1 /TAXON_ID=47934 /ORGANISM="Dinophysis acuminata, Strain DAEP01" /LENGTH=202 /DNA_ID=CAMNT_0020952839 /DNA_START=265 /DNA_END=874 /DNA_ORIENTATION=+
MNRSWSKGYGYTAAGLHHVATDRALESPSSSQAPGQQQASRALHRDPVPAEAEDAGGRLEVAAYPAEISLSRVEVATCRRQGAATAPLRQHRLDLHHLGGVRRQLEWDVFLSSLRGQEPPARTWLPGSMDRFRWEAVVRQAEERVVSIETRSSAGVSSATKGSGGNMSAPSAATSGSTSAAHSAAAASAPYSWPVSSNVHSF